MSNETVEASAKAMKKHLVDNGKTQASLIFHGGEPLLGGVKHLQRVTSIILQVFDGSGIQLNMGMQSNGLLFDEKIGDFMLSNEITIGISIDGPPEINDKFRVDHQGRGSSKKLEDRLRLLTSQRYKSLFKGFLVVVDVTSDPIETLDYLVSLDAPSVDFLLPYDNHDRLPPGKVSWQESQYADWLIEAYDYWLNNNLPLRIRHFDSILRMIFGGSSLVESIGLSPVDLIVIETNGDIEAVDSLKAVFNGATKLGYNVFENSFDEVSDDVSVQSRQLGVNELCEKCQACEVVSICGGGYLPTRYSNENGFLNPSVYCFDHSKTIKHIHKSAIQAIK